MKICPAAISAPCYYPNVIMTLIMNICHCFLSRHFRLGICVRNKSKAEKETEQSYD